jgi:hypothetical protein
MNVEVVFIRSTFSIYCMGYIGYLVYLVFTLKKSFPVIEFFGNFSFIVLMTKLIRDEVTISIEDKSDQRISLALILFCIVTFMFGWSLGKSSTEASLRPKTSVLSSSSNASASSNGAIHKAPSVTNLVERKIRLKPRADLTPATDTNLSDTENLPDHSADLLAPPICHQDTFSIPPASLSSASTSQYSQPPTSSMSTDTVVLSSSSSEHIQHHLGVGGVQTTDDIHFIPPFADCSYAELADRARSTVLSIIGLLNYPGTNMAYSSCGWTVVPSGPMANLWVSRSKDDGILLRATCLLNTPAKSVLKWIMHNDLTIGVENLAFRKETLKVFKSGSHHARLRRLSCRSGSITSSKRDLVLITGHTTMADGTIVVASRSLHVPETITAAARKPNKNGFIRGILYGR